MRIVDIIEKKRNHEVLTTAEINFWIDGIMDKSIADYQSSALLMAIVLNGMNTQETSDLTMAMLNSGDRIDLSDIAGIKVDKHSTGGVGDKSTLVLAPIVAAAGAKVAKMSGRGLGHTGGTIDKLEAIPNYNIELSKADFIKQVNDINIALVGQSGEIVPADKIIYALRDVTATVDSLSLIAASIMSKKLASGADTILLDVKYGDGAFMETKAKAIELAQVMIDIGKHLNKNVKAMITNMNEPLGFAIGNSLEVIEAIETLNNQGPADLSVLTKTSAAIMLKQAKLVNNIDEGLILVESVVESGAALNKFKALISAQGGDASVVDDTSKFTQSKYKSEIKSKQAGYLAKVKTSKLGKLAMELGAGRKEVNDDINYAVGLKLHHKIGDFVDVDDILINVFHDDILTSEFIDDLLTCFTFSNEKVAKADIIAKIL